MSRLWIGILILLLLPALGAGVLWGSGAFFGDLTTQMEQASQAALEGNWTLAQEKVENCREKWEKYRHFWASLTDHAPMEQVQLLFSQLSLYEGQRLAVEFSAGCRSLAREAEAIGEIHGLRWWSIL